jgi:ferrous iron transport protein B
MPDEKSPHNSGKFHMHKGGHHRFHRPHWRTEHIEHHTHPDQLSEIEGPRIVVALVGNPNVGKSLIFNFLSGMYVDVSNYPGTTVEFSKGMYNDYDIYDTPGVYGISSFSEEENVTRDVVLKADIVLDIVDSVHLERDLFLTQQLIDMGKNVAVILNFQDELKKQGITVDIEVLSRRLGVPVFQTSAVSKEGFDRLKDAIRSAHRGSPDRGLHSKLHDKLKEVGSEAEALLILEGDETLAKKHGVHAGSEREKIYIERRNRVNLTVSAVLKETQTRARASRLIGRWAINIWTGIPMLLIALYCIYLFVGKLVAQDLVSIMELHLGKEAWEPWIRGVMAHVVDPQSSIGIILTGDFGVLTMTVSYLLFLLLPLVAAFYLALAFLEDSGYLPRLATLVDRSLSAIGLNGSAIIPLILGFGCVTMATVTTRLLGTEREKTIATTILQFAIPCSAQIAVVAALLTGAGYEAMILYSLTILAVLVGIGTILHRVLPGESSSLLIDLPPMRVPRLDNIFKKTAFRSYYFMKEATPWFFAGALVIGLMQVTGLLILWQNLISPVVTGWLHLPKEASTAFVMGLVRRDFGAAGLYSLQLTAHQVVVALVTITLFVPCIASLMVMLKERGPKEATIIWLGTWVGAFVVGGIVANILVYIPL